MNPHTTAPLSKQYATVHGKQMAYHDVGSSETGESVVLLHGNPTSSYLWRNIVPHLSGLARCIVPDLIGQGDSDKLDNPGPDSYTFIEHRTYPTPCSSNSISATRSPSSFMTGVRPLASIGQTGTASGSQVLPTWRQLFAP
ncbi:MAG: alpha/beta fold hydrolase [Acidimicrobiales bacterium]